MRLVVPGFVAVLVAVTGLAAAPVGASPARTGHETPLLQLPAPADNLGWFGTATAISRNTAVVVAIHTMVPVGGGSFQEDQGQAFIYARQGRQWSPTPVATLLAPNDSGQFGTQVAVSGTTVVVSDPNTSPESVYLYSQRHGRWPTAPTVTLTDPLWTPGDGLNDAFGESMAISGRTLLVGSANVGGDGDGVVYEYTEGRHGWPTTPTMTMVDPAITPSPATNDGFGENLGLSGTTAIIGAYGAEGDGLPVVYEYSEGAAGWPTTPTETLLDGSSNNECFGDAGIAVSATTALVGGGCDHPATGVVYVYAKSGSVWARRPVARFVDPAPGENNYFGTVEAVSGGTALVGAWGFNNRAGRAYLYRRGPGGVWNTTPSAVIADPTATDLDGFGVTLGLFGRTAVIGAPDADPDNATSEAGLAYFYRS
jgi:hypothetical protein